MLVDLIQAGDLELTLQKLLNVCFIILVDRLKAVGFVMIYHWQNQGGLALQCTNGLGKRLLMR